MFGTHMWKSWSTNQAVIALSSGEAEYYALVKAGSVSIGVQTLMQEMGIHLEGAVELNSDASAAIGISNRIGSGKVRHIEVTQLWLQDKVSSGAMKVRKVGTDDNLADALTKCVDASAVASHVRGVGIELRSDRHAIAPELDGGVSVEVKLEGE